MDFGINMNQAIVIIAILVIAGVLVFAVSPKIQDFVGKAAASRI